MSNIGSYKELIVWQKSMTLAELIYKTTEEFPKEETFGLVSQMRRCAVSIPSNIAEGSGRGTRKDYRQFLLIAYGSSLELETQLEISKRLHIIKDYEKIIEPIIEVQKMLYTMIGRLHEKPRN